MKILTSFFLYVAAIAVIAPYPVAAQGFFQNLDFESATLVPVPGDPYQRVSADFALPHWTAYSGTDQLGAVLYDNAFISSTGVSIVDSGWRGVLGGDPVGAIEGNFSVLMQAGDELGSGGTRQADLRLTQTGIVPASARSVWFLAHAAGAPPSVNPSFSVTLGGINLDLTSMPGGPNSTTVYGADVSAFAGQSGALSFTLFAPQAHGEAYLYLDEIRFSPTIVPEPSTFILFGLGCFAGVICWALRRKRKVQGPARRG